MLNLVKPFNLYDNSINLIGSAKYCKAKHSYKVIFQEHFLHSDVYIDHEEFEDFMQAKGFILEDEIMQMKLDL